jgi:PST family polysaccharide transporter
VLSFPITYILLVRDRGGYYIATEVLRDILYIAFIRMGWQVFGLEIAGLAFLVVYLIHFITVYAICSRLYNVKLLKKNIKFLLLSLLLSGLAYLNIKFSFSDLSFLVGGIILTIMASYFSYRVLKELYDIRSLLRKLFKGGDR